MDKQHQTNERYNQIKSLYQFISKSSNHLNNILSDLDWNEEATFLKEGKKTFNVCLQNQEHRVGSDNFEKHMAKCIWHRSGYTDDSLYLPEACGSFETTVLLDKNLQADIILNAAAQDPTIKIAYARSDVSTLHSRCGLRRDVCTYTSLLTGDKLVGGGHYTLNYTHKFELTMTDYFFCYQFVGRLLTNDLFSGDNVWERDVPQTSDRVFSDFTRDERRVLYDYVVSRTSAAVPRLTEFTLPSGEVNKSEPLTTEQLLTAERDAKRRRVRYRTAKVHTKSKNYSEVMREVINNQMQAYEDWLRYQSGVTESASSVLVEKENPEESVKKKQEMIWLGWDYRTNPHVRWKDLVEQEKRKETGSTEERRNACDRKDKDKEKIASKKSSHNESRQYIENHWYSRYYHNSREKESEKGSFSKKEFFRDDSGQSDRNIDLSRKTKNERGYDRHHQSVSKDFRNTVDGKRRKNEGEKESRYREYQSNSDYYRTYIHEDKHDNKHSGERYYKENVKVKQENESTCSVSRSEHEDRKKQDSFDNKYKEEQVSTTESEGLSSKSSHSDSICTKKQSKRKRKSKKKRKKKHKSKRSKYKSNSESDD